MSTVFVGSRTPIPTQDLDLILEEQCGRIDALFAKACAETPDEVVGLYTSGENFTNRLVVGKYIGCVYEIVGKKVRFSAVFTNGHRVATSDPDRGWSGDFSPRPIHSYELYTVSVKHAFEIRKPVELTILTGTDLTDIVEDIVNVLREKSDGRPEHESSA